MARLDVFPIVNCSDLARTVATAGVNLDLLYLATHTRVVFGSPDLPALRAALGVTE